MESLPVIELWLMLTNCYLRLNNPVFLQLLEMIVSLEYTHPPKPTLSFPPVIHKLKAKKKKIAMGPSFFPFWVRTAAISLVALKNCSEISCYDGLLKKQVKEIDKKQFCLAWWQ